ncbi:MAG: hypothetical protein IT249_08025 [Chitinophagaceae bacterium]|nr:hypothetical protein [Chitinophagaceae bacterium]
MPTFVFIISRIVIAACLVLILGYVFGNFSTKPLLVKLTKVASILVLVGFIMGSIFILRFRSVKHEGNISRSGWCQYQHLQTDSARNK